MASLKGKVIAVTGAASGIGFEAAKLLASRGAKISVADLSPDIGEIGNFLKESTGNSDVLTAQVDVRDVESIKAWIVKTVEKFGRLDGAANIAGVYKAYDAKTVVEEDEANWKLMLDINLTGTMHCLRQQAAYITTGGSVVNTASILATRGWAGAAAYSSSKHGVVGLTKSAAKELGPKGVRVNCIAPGYIDTPMLKSATSNPSQATTNDTGASSVPLRRMGRPDEVAHLVAFLLGDEASYITGTCISVD